MNPMNIFVGVPQSKYAGIAILVAMIFIAFAMIFGKEQVPIGQKFLFVLIMFVVALPTILFTLFQLTCLVTGAGMKNQRWWCAAYAWIGTIFIILYSVILVVVGISSLINGHNVLAEVNNTMTFEQMQVAANRHAAEYFQNMDLPKSENPMAQSMAETTTSKFTVGPTRRENFQALEDQSMAEFTVGPKNESFQIPEATPPESEADKETRRMMQNAVVPAPAPLSGGMENFADFTLTEEEKQEMFGNRR
jgi:hypothetical protein